MEIPGILQTIAEISIAFAGFSGLIIALRRGSGPLSETQVFRLQVLLGLALGAMFLSLLPESLHHLGMPAAKIWLVCSSLLTAYSIVFIWLWVMKARVVMRTAPEIFNWFAFSRMATGHALVVLLQLSSIFSLVEVPITGAFVIGLIWYLLHTTQQFFRMLFISPKTQVNPED